MATHRTKPKIGTAPSKDSNNCFWIPLTVIGSYFVWSALTRITSGYGSSLDYVICFGVLIGLAVLYYLAGREKEQEGIELNIAEEQWKNKCVFANVSIVDRKHSPGGAYEDGYGDLHSYGPSYQVYLEMSADQRSAVPDQTVVSADVSWRIYDLLKNRNSIRIYYRPEAPFTFLLEGEI